MENRRHNFFNILFDTNIKYFRTNYLIRTTIFLICLIFFQYFLALI